MSHRLPIPGSDDGTWGEILNSFLEVSLNADGTLIPSAIQQAGGVTSVNGKAAISGSLTLNASNIGALPSTTKLAGLADTSSAAGASDGQVLSYDSSSNSWVPATVSSSVVPDATTSNKGIVQLAGDIGAGTASASTSY